MRNPGRGFRNEFRIIAGEWRRRRFKFPVLPGIRPSPDRVRETLFNWLQVRVIGAQCLDLFAGSGALGLEALSRGAAQCVFVDQQRAVLDSLKAHLDSLQTDRAELIQADAIRYLGGGARRFDLVFLDPPFDSDLLIRALAALDSSAWLAAGARVYIEYAAEHRPTLPGGWSMLRESQAGNVGFGLTAPGDVPSVKEPTL